MNWCRLDLCTHPGGPTRRLRDLRDLIAWHVATRRVLGSPRKGHPRAGGSEPGRLFALQNWRSIPEVICLPVREDGRSAIAGKRAMSTRPTMKAEEVDPPHRCRILRPPSTPFEPGRAPALDGVLDEPALERAGVAVPPEPDRWRLVSFSGSSQVLQKRANRRWDQSIPLCFPRPHANSSCRPSASSRASFAFLLFADFGGSRADRLRAYLLLALVGVALTAIGTVRGASCCRRSRRRRSAASSRSSPACSAAASPPARLSVDPRRSCWRSRSWCRWRICLCRGCSAGDRSPRSRSRSRCSPWPFARATACTRRRPPPGSRLRRAAIRN